MWTASNCLSWKHLIGHCYSGLISPAELGSPRQGCGFLVSISDIIIRDCQLLFGFPLEGCACSPAPARASYWPLEAPQLGWPTGFEAVGWFVPARFRTSRYSRSNLFRAFQGNVSIHLSKGYHFLFDLPAFANSTVIIAGLEPCAPQLPAAPHSLGIIWAAPGYLNHSILFQHCAASSWSRFSWSPPPACPPWP